MMLLDILENLLSFVKDNLNGILTGLIVTLFGWLLALNFRKGLSIIKKIYYWFPFRIYNKNSHNITNKDDSIQTKIYASLESCDASVSYEVKEYDNNDDDEDNSDSEIKIEKYFWIRIFIYVSSLAINKYDIIISKIIDNNSDMKFSLKYKKDLHKIGEENSRELFHATPLTNLVFLCFHEISKKKAKLLLDAGNIRVKVDIFNEYNVKIPVYFDGERDLEIDCYKDECWPEDFDPFIEEKSN